MVVINRTKRAISRRFLIDISLKASLGNILWKLLGIDSLKSTLAGVAFRSVPAFVDPLSSRNMSDAF